MDFLISGITSITPQQIVMYVIGAVLIWLAINKDLEPVLLLPLGFGAILVNLPASGVLNQTLAGIGETNGIIEWLFNVGIEASEAMPLLLFIGIGAMIDFGPLLSNPKLFLFGAAAQFGIFAAIVVACFLGFDLKDAASIGIIGAADGPTSILVSQVLGSNYIGPIAVVAYSYMALVPIIQPPIMKLVSLLLGITIAFSMKADTFVNKETLLIMLIGLAAFIFDTAAGVLFAKLMNLFSKEKINPMIGAAGISAFPMAARVVQKMALKEDPSNVLIMQATGTNVSGQIASVVAGGVILNVVASIL